MNKCRMRNPVFIFLCILFLICFSSCSHKNADGLPSVFSVEEADIAFNRGEISWDEYLEAISPYFIEDYITENHMERCWANPPIDLPTFSEDERKQLADADPAPKIELGVSDVYDDAIPDQKIVMTRLIIHFSDLPDAPQQCNQRFHLREENGAWKIVYTDVYWAVSAQLSGNIPPEEDQKYNKAGNKIVEYTWTTIE
jgi:hypothetical protein